MAVSPVVTGVAATALWTAYCRAEESKRDAPLVCDPLAERLCGDDGMIVGQAFEAQGGAHDAIVVRTRILDEHVVAAFARGVRTVLSLGCGLCARPYRLDAPAGARFVEVDLPETIAWKERRLTGVPSRPGVSVSRFSSDLADPEGLEAPLRAIDDAPIVVVLEGVLQYLDESVVRALFTRLARRGRSTTVVCDVGGGTWSRFFGRRIPEAVAQRGAPYRTRIDDPRAFFRPLGFAVTSDVALVDWDARRPAPRWRTPWTARLVPGFRSAARVIELAAR